MSNPNLFPEGPIRLKVPGANLPTGALNLKPIVLQQPGAGASPTPASVLGDLQGAYNELGKGKVIAIGVALALVGVVATMGKANGQ